MKAVFHSTPLVNTARACLAAVIMQYGMVAAALPITEWPERPDGPVLVVAPETSACPTLLEPRRDRESPLTQNVFFGAAPEILANAPRSFEEPATTLVVPRLPLLLVAVQSTATDL